VTNEALRRGPAVRIFVSRTRICTVT